MSGLPPGARRFWLPIVTALLRKFGSSEPCSEFDAVRRTIVKTHSGKAG